MSTETLTGIEERIDWLVDKDTLMLRDLALWLAAEVRRKETLRAELAAEVDQLTDVVHAALGYVNAPDGTDQVEQCWWELRNAVANYQRAAGGDSTDGTS